MPKGSSEKCSSRRFISASARLPSAFVRIEIQERLDDRAGFSQIRLRYDAQAIELGALPLEHGIPGREPWVARWRIGTPMVAGS
jgi:hypothetical protein